MKTMPKAEVSLPGESEVKVTRQFRAPRELVYQAYTRPELVKRWMLGPPGWDMPVCEMDVRVGGEYRWRWRNQADGSEFGFHGSFTEVDAPARLAHTQHYDAGDVGGDMGEAALVALALSEAEGITTVTTVIDFRTREARDGALSTGMTDGMEMGYRRLDELLAERSGT
ncbi:SRPBCC family protein [Luteimonas sp. SJ-92]|uniref:SRPBCC family protein n=1 Tax=Luteimonas salinisoli TaxID=2752307 RepID=A0A853JF16_9GAMM|nr:SRPBCC family protein [Luteimonas salinisoli]NZA27199.1 SRPBCC family protein [Luteimonas salinisoli]